VDNEYTSWEKSLMDIIKSENDFSNFKSNDWVKRMVGASSLEGLFISDNSDLPWNDIQKIDRIGNPPETEKVLRIYDISTISLRYVHYANKILDIIKNYPEIRIVEIGGGYGGMCAILNCIAKYRKIKIDSYAIYDLKGVQEFQNHYLKKINQSTDIGIKSVDFLDSSNLDLFTESYNYVTSFYALGEFDEETKYNYINKVISKIKNGFILWNPHRSKDTKGEDLLLSYHPNADIKKEEPLTSEHNLEIII
jgi:putative sugar O-methyltransferase